MTRRENPRERFRLDPDPVRFERSADRVGCGFGVESAHWYLARPVPERRVHLREAVFEIRRSREHEEQRESDTDLLRGVQQGLPQPGIESVGLVEQHDERSRTRPTRENLRQRLRPLSARPPRQARQCDPLRRQTAPPRRGQERAAHVGRRLHFRRSQMEGIHPGCGFGVVVEPDEQRGLPVAARAVQDDVARRRRLRGEISHQPGEEILLRLPSREIRRDPPRAGAKRAEHARQHPAGV